MHGRLAQNAGTEMADDAQHRCWQQQDAVFIRATACMMQHQAGFLHPSPAQVRTDSPLQARRNPHCREPVMKTNMPSLALPVHTACRAYIDNETFKAAGTHDAGRRKPQHSSKHSGQQDEQQYSSWDGRIDKAAVEALLQQEPDNPHHIHNIDRCGASNCLLAAAAAGQLQ